jgi:aspartyl aminopeptidase
MRSAAKLAVVVLVALPALAPAQPKEQAVRRDRRLDRRHDQQEIGHRKTAWQRQGFDRKRAFGFADDYKSFLTRNKTEREVARAALAQAKKKGFADLLADKRPKVAPGARLYAAVHGKLLALIVVGKRPLVQGVHLVATHIDSVRLDLKQKPLYADGNLALLQTHYYGGIKKYQWLSIPLELRGVVVKKDGTAVEVAIGDQPSEPVLVIPDLAVHMSGGADSTEGEEVPGESLDPIVGSTPGAGEDPFAAEAGRVIERELKIALGDLASAELELVPAAPARDVGLDRAMIGGYGQDDRACSYAALRAILEIGTPDHTAIVMLTDKEEVGSTGNTGAQSTFMRRIAAELIEGSGKTSSETAVERLLSTSMVWSADVTGAVNPHYPGVYEAQNEAFTGAGVVWDYTAVHAEVMSYTRRLLDKAGIAHQAAGWGKSTESKTEDGTVLAYFTRLGMNGLNVSIPLLSMHAPYELVSKADLYEGYRAYRAFLAD